VGLLEGREVSLLTHMVFMSVDTRPGVDLCAVNNWTNEV